MQALRIGGGEVLMPAGGRGVVQCRSGQRRRFGKIWVKNREGGGNSHSSLVGGREDKISVQARESNNCQDRSRWVSKVKVLYTTGEGRSKA